MNNDLSDIWNGVLKKLYLHWLPAFEYRLAYSNLSVASCCFFTRAWLSILENSTWRVLLDRLLEVTSGQLIFFFICSNTCQWHFIRICCAVCSLPQNRLGTDTTSLFLWWLDIFNPNLVTLCKGSMYWGHSCARTEDGQLDELYSQVLTATMYYTPQDDFEVPICAKCTQIWQQNSKLCIKISSASQILWCVMYYGEELSQIELNCPRLLWGLIFVLEFRYTDSILCYPHGLFLEIFPNLKLTQNRVSLEFPFHYSLQFVILIYTYPRNWGRCWHGVGVGVSVWGCRAWCWCWL